MTSPQIPPSVADLDRIALFLDLDGTLADIAAEPSIVTIESATIETLAELSLRLGGALAIISGRELTDIDRLFAPTKLPVAAVHGALRRNAYGEILQGNTADVFEEIERTLIADLEGISGLLIERKSAAVAVHFRANPEAAEACEKAVRAIVDTHDGVRCQPGKMVYEIVPASVDKGKAILTFLSEAPFKGRQPIFAGDDITDEAGFAAVNHAGGVSIKIGSGETLAQFRLAKPSDVRSWLAGLADEATGDHFI